MKRYCYNGPVMLFNKCIADIYIASTMAPSKKKARSNLEYRYKKDHDLNPNAKITFPGDLDEFEGDEPYARIPA